MLRNTRILCNAYTAVTPTLVTLDMLNASNLATSAAQTSVNHLRLNIRCGLNEAIVRMPANHFTGFAWCISVTTPLNFDKLKPCRGACIQ